MSDKDEVERLRQLILEWGKAYAAGDYVKSDGVFVGEYNKLYVERKEKI
jgi:hypothetical protein